MPLESIIIDQIVRPIRFGFLVYLNDLNTVLKAISYNTVLWGGIYNPIIPVWKKFPTKLQKQRTMKMISAFDVDFIVNLTSFEPPKELLGLFESHLMKEIKLVKGSKNSLEFTMAMDILPLLRYTFEKENPRYNKAIKEFMYLTDEDNKINKLSYFLCGRFPTGFKLDYRRKFSEMLDAKAFKSNKKRIEQLQFIDKIISPLDFTSKTLRPLGFSDGMSNLLLYFGDDTNLLDLIEFWNIRASAKDILFIPMQSYEHYVRTIRNIIQINKEIQVPRTVIILGSSIEENDFNSLKNWFREMQIDIPMFSQNSIYGRYNDLQTEIIPQYLESKSYQEIAILDNENLSACRLISPPFIDRRRDTVIGKYSWAVDIDLWDNRRNELFFKYPQDKSLNKLIKHITAGTSRKTRIGRNGIVVFPEYISDNIHLFPARVKDVFKTIFKFYGWKIEPSPAGRIAEGIIQFMGNLSYGCRVFKVEGVRKILGELSRQKRLSSSDLTRCMNIINKIKNSDHTKNELKFLEDIIKEKLPLESKAFNRDYIIKTIGNCWKSEYNDIYISPKQNGELNASFCFEHMLDKNIIEPGLFLECNICGKKDWYAFSTLDKTFKCKFCLTKQNISSVEKKWHYKPNGLFKIPNIGEGSIGVILTLWRFQQLSLGFTYTFKYITSFILRDIKTGKEYEVDFSLLVYDNLKETYNLVLGEAKSFIDFKKRDFQRLSKIGNIFPEKPYLCFSTLKNKFNEKEKIEIKKLLKKGFPVIALTKEEIEPYDLNERFKNSLHKFALSLNDFSENTLALNILNETEIEDFLEHRNR